MNCVEFDVEFVIFEHLSVIFHTGWVCKYSLPRNMLLFFKLKNISVRISRSKSFEDGIDITD